MKFRKKPVEIEAVQFRGDNYREVEAFVGEDLTYFARSVTGETDTPQIQIRTRDGDMYASKGDWVIREPFPTDDRRYYPCKPEIFDQSYEPVE